MAGRKKASSSNPPGPAANPVLVMVEPDADDAVATTSRSRRKGGKTAQEPAPSADLGSESIPSPTPASPARARPRKSRTAASAATLAVETAPAAAPETDVTALPVPGTYVEQAAGRTRAARKPRLKPGQAPASDEFAATIPGTAPEVREAIPTPPAVTGMTLDLFASIRHEAAASPAATASIAEPAPSKIESRLEKAVPEAMNAAEPIPAFSAVETRPWPAMSAAAARPEAPTECTAERSTIVFDLDGTLVRGDCGDRYLRWLLRRNPLRWLAALLVAPIAMPLLFLPATRRQAISVFLWLATLGLDEAKLAALAARFIADYRLRPIRSAVEALQEEVSRGHRVVVATGALRVLAEGLLRRLDAREGVDIVASDIGRCAGGWIVRWQCNGQVKLQRLQAEGFPGPYLRAYSDHWSDRWLLAAAGTPVLVNASAKHRQQLRAKFGQKLRVVLWQ